MPTAQGDPGSQPSEDPRVVRTRHDIVGTAMQVMMEEGWDSVTHARVAQVAGYSKATIYKHWPTRVDLLREVFAHLSSMPHHAPAGDLRSDLVCELQIFRDGMTHHGLDRALAVLSGLALTNPEIAVLRDQLVADGERVMRQLLATVLEGEDLEGALLMLSGSVFYAALMGGRPPDDETIRRTVDRFMASLPG